MKSTMLVQFALLVLFSGCVNASSCEDNFSEEGDPRNGSEYAASKFVADIGVEAALRQLATVAAADGFNVHALEIEGDSGRLTIEQVSGSRPFLIHLAARKIENGSELSIGTRLNRGVTARKEDMRANMCGMLHRVKSGQEGEQIARNAAAVVAAGQAREITAILLARELFRLKKKVGGDQAGADLITARYKGKEFLLDGQIYEPTDPEQSQVDLWYRTSREPGVLNTFEDQNSVYWPTIVCQMDESHRTRASKLRSNDWAKLEGVVSHFQLGTPDRFILTNCRFR